MLFSLNKFRYSQALAEKLLNFYINQVPEKLFQIHNNITLKFIWSLYLYSKSDIWLQNKYSSSALLMGYNICGLNSKSDIWLQNKYSSAHLVGYNICGLTTIKLLSIIFALELKNQSIKIQYLINKMSWLDDLKIQVQKLYSKFYDHKIWTHEFLISISIREIGKHHRS